MRTITFPQGFRWGTATAAHQVEGGNVNNNWWEWEHAEQTPCVEPSGDACDHYHRFRDDIRLLAELGFDTYRFSVEWSRLEPADGEFSVASLRHYRAMAAACREVGIEPVVTLHHFTDPVWLEGGWTSPATAARFARYVEYVVDGLAGLVDAYCTINEPNIVATMGYLTGLFPPGHRDVAERLAANDVLIEAHHRAVEAVRRLVPQAQVGLTLAMSEWTAVDGGDETLEQLREPMEDVFLEAAVDGDFVGVQTYSRHRVGPGGYLGPEPGAETTLMGYEYRPRALEATIRRASAMTRLPVWVTENGIATDDDRRRIAFVTEALRAVHDCLDDGIDVVGYTYWSAFDNFEWALGYAPTFGLIAVDRTTQLRTVKPSARRLGSVARANAL